MEQFTVILSLILLAFANFGIGFVIGCAWYERDCIRQAEKDEKELQDLLKKLRVLHTLAERADEKIVDENGKLDERLTQIGASYRALKQGPNNEEKEHKKTQN